MLQGAVRGAGAKGAWAILDQALPALANFGLTIWLARWLGAQEYGVYSTAYAASLLASTIHTAFVTEPTVIIGARWFQARSDEYLASISLLGTGVGILLAALQIALASIGDAIFGQSLLHALIGASLALPPTLTMWHLRRMSLLIGKPHIGAEGGTVYLIILMLATILGSIHFDPSPIVAYSGIAGAGLCAVAWCAWRMKLKKPTLNRQFMGEILSHHIRYGRWSLPAQMAHWLYSNVAYILLPLTTGYEATGAYRAAMNFLVPFSQGTGALSYLVMPYLSRSNSAEKIWKLSSKISLAFVGPAIVYAALLIPLSSKVISILYSTEMHGVSSASVFVLLAAVPMGLSAAYGSALKALEQPKGVFGAYAIAGLASFASTWLLAPSFGAVGAGCAMLLATVVGAVSLSVALRRAVGEK